MGGFVLQQLKALIGCSFHQQFIVFHYVPFMCLLNMCLAKHFLAAAWHL